MRNAKDAASTLSRRPESKVVPTKKPAALQPAFGLLNEHADKQTGAKPSARRLAAAGEADLFLQAIEADGADHDLLADHIARRAVHAHVLGELEVFLQRRADLRARNILFQFRHVEAG